MRARTASILALAVAAATPGCRDDVCGCADAAETAEAEAAPDRGDADDSPDEGDDAGGDADRGEAASDDAADPGLADEAAPDDAADSADLADIADDSCEARFWRHWVETNNAGYADIPGLAASSLAYIRGRVDDLNARGASITLGGTLSLLVFEGGARVAFYNDRCSENSYVSGPRCWETPQARYSYQLGMGVIHTSNFYPCRDVGWTSRMRARFHEAAAAHGFAPTAEQLASVAGDLATVCAGYAPEPIDYYILAIHSAFGVPTDGSGNHLALVGAYPFFTPEVSIDMFFGELGGDPTRLTSDRAAIAVFGGADDRYSDPGFQDEILSLWEEFRATSCP